MALGAGYREAFDNLINSIFIEPMDRGLSAATSFLGDRFNATMGGFGRGLAFMGESVSSSIGNVFTLGGSSQEAGVSQAPVQSAAVEPAQCRFHADHNSIVCPSTPMVSGGRGMGL